MGLSKGIDMLLYEVLSLLEIVLFRDSYSSLNFWASDELLLVFSSSFFWLHPVRLNNSNNISVLRLIFDEL